MRWFADGELNVAANCLDRHLAKRPEQTAILWEPDDPNDSTRLISYRELHESVCKFANALKRLGAKKGDRVTIYMPMIPETAIAMLACARIGAVHSVVFGGFSPEALKGRIEDCASRDRDHGRRRRARRQEDAAEGQRRRSAEERARNDDRARRRRQAHGRQDVAWVEGRDKWYEDVEDGASEVCPRRADERRGSAVHSLYVGLDG